MDFDRITVANVSRHYGRRRALSRVSFEAAAGELIGILGPNGAGKSTLLGLLATLVRPSKGAIHYGRHTAASGGMELRGRIGFLSHELQIYTELTAVENLEFFAGLHGLDDPAETARLALERARLSSRGDDVVNGFSRGMRQRLAVERALLHDPRLVLLDEPFTGLDEASTNTLRDRLRTLAGQDRIVLAATHDLDVADGLFDRVVVIRNGSLTELAPSPASLRERYHALLASDEES